MLLSPDHGMSVLDDEAEPELLELQHLPAAGELVLFDRSRYNRAGVERVMGLVSVEEYDRFAKQLPPTVLASRTGGTSALL